MKFNHEVEITPHEDRVHCGKCSFGRGFECKAFRSGRAFRSASGDYVRCDACREAERKWREKG